MPNPTATINNPDDSVRMVVVGADATETPRLVNGTVTTSNYSAGYVAKAGPGEFYFKPNNGVFPTIPGSSMLVNVTFNCFNASGTAIPPQVVDVILAGPPLPPNATHLNFTEGPVTGRFSVPADPLTATISF